MVLEASVSHLAQWTLQGERAHSLFLLFNAQASLPNPCEVNTSSTHSCLWPEDMAEGGFIVRHTGGKWANTCWPWPETSNYTWNNKTSLIHVCWMFSSPERKRVKNSMEFWNPLGKGTLWHTCFFSIQWTKRFTVSTTKRTAKFLEMQSHFWLT